ncbi:MAG: hypothetical protein ABI723_13080 [Bacteroidia bacterium]
MPTIKELERELENESEKLLKPKDKKLNNLKELISGLKYGELKEKCNPQNTLIIFQKVLLPLKKQLAISIADISNMFKQTEIILWTDRKGHSTEKAAKDYLIKNKHCGEFRIEIKTKGFMKAGIKAFDCWKNLNIILNEYKYTVEFEKQNQKPLFEKLYNQLLTKTELNVVAENFCEILLDHITAQVERIKKQKPKNKIIKKRVINK